MFLIVEMVEDGLKTVDIVPDIWFNHSTSLCAWPPKKNPTAAVKSQTRPEANWRWYEARALHQFPTYEDARRKIGRAEDTSDLNTDTEETPQRNVRRLPKRQMSYKEDSSDEAEIKLPCLALHASSKSFSDAQNFTALDPPPPPPQGPSGMQNVIYEMDESPVSGFTNAAANLISLDSGQIFVTSAKPETNSAEIIELLKKLIGEVACVKQYVINLDKKVDQLRTSASVPSTDVNRFKRLPVPFNSVEGLNQFDSVMTEVDHADMRDWMIQKGGNSTVEHVGRVLKKLLTPELATKYSLKGQKGNENFSSTKLWEALKESALIFTLHGPDEKKIEKAVSEWFRHANEKLKKLNNSNV